MPDPGDPAKAALAGAAALVVVALVGSAAYWAPRLPSFWSDVGGGTMLVYMLHRCVVPLTKTLFRRCPLLVRLDAFFGLPFFLALQALLALGVPAALSWFVVKLRRKRYASVPSDDIAPFLLDNEKKDAHC